MYLWEVEYKAFNSILFHAKLVVRAANINQAKERADSLLEMMDLYGMYEWVGTSDVTSKYLHGR